MSTPPLARPSAEPASTNGASKGGDSRDLLLIAGLHAGEEWAFTALVDAYHASLVHVAMAYVTSRAVAEEVAQETWLAVVTGIERFEGRSSLKTWIFRILTNLAKTRGLREGRSVPLSALAEDAREAAVDPARFINGNSPRTGHWASAPASWDAAPDERLIAKETLSHLQAAIAALPPTQREVITLRDVEGWRAQEVCELLGLSQANQRVLLHRARSKVRAALEATLEPWV